MVQLNYYIITQFDFEIYLGKLLLPISPNGHPLGNIMARLTFIIYIPTKSFLQETRMQVEIENIFVCGNIILIYKYP